MQIENHIGCHSEYDELKRVIVAPATYMAITEVINETQKHYMHDNIDPNRAERQRQQLVDVLEDAAITVDQLPVKEKLNEQVFTRDIGFTLADQLFIAHMASDIRTKETTILKEYLLNQALPFRDELVDPIEGGDVMIDRDRVFIGVSDRTSTAAIKQIAAALPSHSIYPITLAGDILHLDCTFNIISETEALIYRPGMKEKDLKKLEAMYDLIDVSEEEQFTLGTNVLSIGQKRIISMPTNQHVNTTLRERGYDVIEVAFDEIIKSGGSFRCCTLPVLRA